MLAGAAGSSAGEGEVVTPHPREIGVESGMSAASVLPAWSTACGRSTSCDSNTFCEVGSLASDLGDARELRGCGNRENNGIAGTVDRGPSGVVRPCFLCENNLRGIIGKVGNGCG